MLGAMHALEPILFALPRFVAAFIFLMAARWIFPKVTPYDVTKEISEADNPAFSAVFSGYMLAAAFALCGALYGAEGDLVGDLISVSIGGAATLTLLPLSLWLIDRGLLRAYPVAREVSEDRNLGAGFVLGGAALATGLVIEGALTGHSDGITALIRDIVVYWAAGQLLLLVSGAVFQKLMPFDVHARIEQDDNAAVGLAFGGFLAGMGVVVRASLEGASSDVWVELGVIALWGLMGLVVLSVAAALLDRVLLPKVDIAYELVNDRNLAVGGVVASSFVAAAILLAAALHPSSHGTPAAPAAPTAASHETAGGPDDLGEPGKSAGAVESAEFAEPGDSEELGGAHAPPGQLPGATTPVHGQEVTP
ncbi:MAG: DUF350 domain-containing protein [Myxococcales bacterium]|nr:DUF350 domain-containing protein [Myxococcales bacterium]